jgi:hypothetical protein
VALTGPGIGGSTRSARSGLKGPNAASHVLA